MLRVENLDLFYGDAQALDRVSLQAPAREIVAIVGANGAGKTSLIRAVAGMARIAGGKVWFEDRDITNLPSHLVCEHGIGQVAEGRQIFPSLSVADNLDLGAVSAAARARAARTLDTIYDYFPVLAQRRRQAAGTLSGGEQQMLAIGRCLMGAPKLIMFDEPSLGLAPVMVQEVFRVIRRLHEEGLSILLVEQNVAVSLKLADHAYVLENGRIVMAGAGADLLHDDRVRRAYLGL